MLFDSDTATASDGVAKAFSLVRSDSVTPADTFTNFHEPAVALETGAGSPTAETALDAGAGSPLSLGAYTYGGDTGAGAPYVIAAPTPTSCEEPPYPPLDAWYWLNGTAGSYMRAVSPDVGRLFLPDTGGLTKFTWGLNIRRPTIPSKTTGTIIQAKRGPASVTVDVLADQSLRIVVNDGTTEVSADSGGSVASLWTDTFLPTVITHDPVRSQIRAYLGNDPSPFIALSTTGIAMPVVGAEPAFTIGANVDGSTLLDLDASGIALWADHILPASHVKGGAGGKAYLSGPIDDAQHGLGNPDETFDPDVAPNVYLRGKAQAGVVPSVVCDGVDGTFDLGTGEVGSFAPLPTSWGDTGQGSPRSFAIVPVVVRDLGQGSPTWFAGVQLTGPRDEGVMSPLLGRTDVDGVFRIVPIFSNPVSIEWWDLGRYGGVLSDRGGEVVTLLTHWPHRGPWRIFFVAQDGTRYPTPSRGAYSGIPGQGDLCYACQALDMLRVAAPPLPVGVYDLRAVHEKSIIVQERFVRVMRRPRYDLVEKAATGTHR